MVRSLIIAILILSGGFLFSKFLIGYPRAGKEYITKHREERKSVRYGSGFYAGGSRGGFKGGK